MPLQHIIQANIKCINSFTLELDQINSDIYSKIPLPLAPSAIGAHVRHIIEHYECFFKTLHSGQINYDHRARIQTIEHNRKEAMYKLQQLNSQLEQLASHYHDDYSLCILLNANLQDHATSETRVDARTSLSRELLILHSHTIHHIAYIAVLLRYFGIHVNSSIGKAPSTLLYEANT